ncbi:MAG: hypothetical protein ABW066_15160 [Sedimenticola sp.]
MQWEAFRKLLSPVYRKGDPSKGGRPPSLRAMESEAMARSPR